MIEFEAIRFSFTFEAIVVPSHMPFSQLSVRKLQGCRETCQQNSVYCTTVPALPHCTPQYAPAAPERTRRGTFTGRKSTAVRISMQSGPQ